MFCHWSSASISLRDLEERERPISVSFPANSSLGNIIVMSNSLVAMRLYHCHYDLQPNLPGSKHPETSSLHPIKHDNPMSS